MRKKSAPDMHETLGSLLRLPYETMSSWLYSELALRGFADIRPAYSAVLRNLPVIGANVSELAASARITKQSMGYLVEQMRVTGLVELTPDKSDHRANIVLLTARGAHAVAAAVELSKEYEARLARYIGGRKMAQLRGLLTELYAKLETSV